MAIARQRRLPYLLRSIGQLNRWSLSQSRGRKQLLLNLVERRNLNRAARLHFTSEAERLEAADLQLRPQPLVLPLGVSLPALAPSPRDDEPIRFLFLSRLHPKKQLESLLQALALVQGRQPQRDWTLQIAGDGDPGYVASLQRLAGSLGLGSRCQWLGFQSGASKQQLLAQAHWFVLPSASENFGIAAAEALAAGTPLIVSPGVALAPAVLQAGAGVVVDPVPECLAVELEAALTPPPQTMRNAARKLAAETYSWPAIAAELEAEYVRILEGR